MNFKKILVMDEEYWSIEPALDRIESLFGKESIQYCSSGMEGLLHLEKNEFKCVILDIMFPIGDDTPGNDSDEDEGKSKSFNGGITVLEMIRNNLKNKIPVICFTMRDDDQVKAAIKKFSNTHHISKINANAMELLMSQIKKHLN